MYATILFLPAIGAAISGLCGKFIGSKGSVLITTGGVLLSFLFSIKAFYEVALCGSPCYIPLFSWISSGTIDIQWGLLFDSLTVVMLIVVTSISSLVHIYSMGYMSHDPHIPRFFSYLSIFTFFMLVLVTSSNMLQLFVGWEGVGVSSYLLINFWFTRIQANKSAMKAMIVNRIGDFGLTIAMVITYYVFQSLDFSTIFALAPYAQDTYITFFNVKVDCVTLICIPLFIGAVGKSAQVGLHTWLPDAMEGPTPVSALIHAATMVTAGVFLIIRCSPLIEYSSTTLSVITIVGALTAFFASTTGLLQNDIKRVIAYSTCSQLGYMVFACGLSSYSLSAFHLMNHAFFKALLFLGAGAVIHAMNDEQDMRRMGRLYRIVPVTYVLMIIASFSLMGVPFLTGFYSKDAILELAYTKFQVDSHFSYWLGASSAIFTILYSVRLIHYSFLGKKTKAYKYVIKDAEEAPNIMLYPLIILGIGSVFIGYFLKDMMIGMGTDFWGNSIFVQPEHLYTFQSEFIPQNIKILPVIFSICGSIIAFILFYLFSGLINSFLFSDIGQYTYKLLNKKWFFDVVYNRYIVNAIVSFAYNVSFKLLDKGIIEVIGPSGTYNTIRALSNQTKKIQSGQIYHYALVLLTGIVGIVSILFYSIYIDILVTTSHLLFWLVLIIFITVYKNNHSANVNK